MKIPFEEIINSINKALWGAPVVILMLFSGVYFTIKTGFFQFTHFGKILRTTILSKRKVSTRKKELLRFKRSAHPLRQQWEQAR